MRRESNLRVVGLPVGIRKRLDNIQSAIDKENKPECEIKEWKERLMQKIIEVDKDKEKLEMLQRRVYFQLSVPSRKNRKGRLKK